MAPIKSGSILIVVSCILSLLILLCSTLIRTGIQTLELSLERIRYERRLRVAITMDNYSKEIIEIYKKSPSQLPLGSRIVHTIDTFKNDGYEGIIMVEKQEQYFQVNTHVRFQGDTQEKILYYQYS